MNKIVSLLAVMLVSLLSVSLVSAFVPGEVTVESVEVNDVDVDLLTQAEIENSNVDLESGLVIDEGEELEVKLVLESTTNAERIQVEAEVRGYEYDDYEDISDRVHVFDLEGTVDAPARKRVTLKMNMPDRLEDDRYLLRVSVDDKDSPSMIGYVVLQVEPTRHGLRISDVAFSPGSTVMAGRSLLASVLLENFGDKDQKDVKVTVAMPQLGVEATEFVDVVETDNHNVDYEDVPEMFLSIPATAAAGDYNVVVTAKYDDLRETVSKTYTVHVDANEMFQTGPNRLVLAVGPESQTVVAGTTVSYGIALTNAGRQSKAYMLEAVASDAVGATLSENLVVLAPGQNKVVRVDVTPTATAPAGTHVVNVVVRSGSEELETVALRANVVAASSADAAAKDGLSLRNGLEIALIILVVLLVIIGLIIGFSRLKKDDEEEQTYY
ncbi:hypothetical protein HYV86_06605 [Candidatus Woesearchaeota archaeon]|nr:hypothetical protein [Candidatus Woesearchaeota archaeon]